MSDKSKSARLDTDGTAVPMTQIVPIYSGPGRVGPGLEKGYAIVQTQAPELLITIQLTHEELCDITTAVAARGSAIESLVSFAEQMSNTRSEALIAQEIGQRFDTLQSKLEKVLSLNTRLTRL